MQSGLYFLFPNETNAQYAIDHLQEGIRISAEDIRVVADFNPRILTPPYIHRGIDVEAPLESRLRNTNLTLFFIALTFFVVAELAFGYPFVASIAVVLMFAAFISGLILLQRLPSAHRDQFREALAHEETLLMVDLPTRRGHEAEHFVHTHYSDAVTGSVNWHLRAMDH